MAKKKTEKNTEKNLDVTNELPSSLKRLMREVDENGTIRTISMSPKEFNDMVGEEPLDFPNDFDENDAQTYLNQYGTADDVITTMGWEEC